MNRDNRHPLDESSLAGLFRRASRFMARRYHRQERFGHAQQRVLSIVGERGTMPQSELLEILDVRSSSLSELLRKLETQGLVTRERNEDDRRSFDISITDEGRALTADNGTETPDDLFACLDETEQEQLRALLQKMVDTLADDPLCAPGRGPGRGGRGKGHGRGMGERGPGNGPGGRGGQGRGRGGRGGRGKGGRS